MLSPLTRSLIKIFAYGFFRINSGFLVFLFGMLISYCFFMNTVGDVKLIPPEQLTYYHFIIVINFISSPLVTLIVGLAWLIYAVKSWIYVTKQLSAPGNQFLFYSITSLSKIKVLKSWFLTQSVIFAPLIFYWIFAFAFGIAFHHYFIPFLILLYLLLLTLVSAVIYNLSINSLQNEHARSYLINLVRDFRKPYYTLFIYQIADKMKIGFILVKIISYLIIAVSISSFAEPYSDLRVAGLVMLAIITGHSFMIYQHHRFDETRLSFLRNLPFKRYRLFFNQTLVYLWLILPEIVWLFSKFNFFMSIIALFLGISTALLFRSILYWTGLRMNRYLPLVFLLFILEFYTVMFKLSVPLLIFNFVLSWIIFLKKYYNSNVTIS
ncbi:hypothetical protein FHS10_000125 [Mucilaginibacter dorajii]|nr:hypothetical protein [Mucilaginibacter dorajii]